MHPDRRSFASDEGASSALLRVVQIGILLIGIIAFVWLINIFALGGDIFPDTAESISQTVWAAILIPILALVLIAEVVLLFFQRS